MEIFCENPCYCDKLQRLLKEIDTDNMLLEEAKSLDWQVFSHPPLHSGVVGSPGVTLRSPLAISLSFASAFVLSEQLTCS